MARYGQDYDRDRGMMGSRGGRGYGGDYMYDDRNQDFGGSMGGRGGYGASRGGYGLGEDMYGDRGMYGGSQGGYGGSQGGYGGNQGGYGGYQGGGFGGGQGGYSGGGYQGGGYGGYGGGYGGSTDYMDETGYGNQGGYGQMGNYGQMGGQGSRQRGMQNEQDNMRASQIMTEDPETVTPDANLADVARMMRDMNVGVIPVVESKENRRLKGLVTDRDITVRAVAEGKDAKSTKVSDVMTSDVETCNKNDSVRDVLNLMEREQVRRVPITDREGRLVGIIAQADVATDYADGRSGRDERVANVLERISEPGRPQRGGRGGMQAGGRQNQQGRQSEQNQQGGQNEQNQQNQPMAAGARSSQQRGEQ